MNIVFCLVNYVYGQTVHVCPYKGFGFVILHECECNQYNNNNNNLIFFLYKNKRVGQFAPQIAGKLVVAGQDKYMNNTII